MPKLKPSTSSSKLPHKKVILLDIDHTVSDAFWRDDMIAAGDWDAYHSVAPNDRPITDIVLLLQCLQDQYTIVGVTARPEKWRKMTTDWMMKHDIPFHYLLMRPDDDFRKAPELKMQLALAAFGDKLSEQVAFVLDDREDVITAFKAIGITALQVHARRGQPQ